MNWFDELPAIVRWALEIWAAGFLLAGSFAIIVFLVTIFAVITRKDL